MGLSPKHPYQLVLAANADGSSAVEPLANFMTNPAGSAIDNWVIFNAIVMAVAMAPIVCFFGWWPVAYLSMSTIFALGVHPVGARWIQEH